MDLSLGSNELLWLILIESMDNFSCKWAIIIKDHGVWSTTPAFTGAWVLIFLSYLASHLFDASKLRIDELPSLLPHFPHGFNFFLLVPKHLQCLLDPEGDGICRISHIVDSHVQICLVVLELGLEFCHLENMNTLTHSLEWAGSPTYWLHRLLAPFTFLLFLYPCTLGFDLAGNDVSQVWKIDWCFSCRLELSL